jgi:hypothetical protein
METSCCPLCGLHRTITDVRALSWSSQHTQDGTAIWICPTCTRVQLFQIETGLPLERAATARVGRAA